MSHRLISTIAARMQEVKLQAALDQAAALIRADMRLSPKLGSVMVGPALSGDDRALGMMPFVLRHRAKEVQQDLDRVAGNIERHLRNNRKDLAIVELKRVKHLVECVES